MVYSYNGKQHSNKKETTDTRINLKNIMLSETKPYILYNPTYVKF